VVRGRFFFVCVSSLESTSFPSELSWLADLEFASGEGTIGAKGKGEEERSADGRMPKSKP
jgi:hypothetical protein